MFDSDYFIQHHVKDHSSSWLGCLTTSFNQSQTRRNLNGPVCCFWRVCLLPFFFSLLKTKNNVFFTYWWSSWSSSYLRIPSLLLISISHLSHPPLGGRLRYLYGYDTVSTLFWFQKTYMILLEMKSQQSIWKPKHRILNQSSLIWMFRIMKSSQGYISGTKEMPFWSVCLPI